MRKAVYLLMLCFFAGLFAQQKTALVLSGGGARSVAHIGVLKVLDRHNIKIDYITGTSMGAVIGALYSIGYSGEEIEDLFLNTNWIELLEEDISRDNLAISQKRWALFNNFRLPILKNYRVSLPQGIIVGNKLINFFFEITYPYNTYRDFSDFDIPFSCTASDILTGEQVVFREGCLHEVLRASMSIPSIFKPVRVNGNLCIDGGITSNLPAEIAYKEGIDFIIGVKTNTEMKNEENLITVFDVLNQTININMLEKIHHSTNYCDLLITPDLSGVSSFNFSNFSEIIETGEKAALEEIDNILKLPRKNNKTKKTERLIEQNVDISGIEIQGSQFISSSKIKEFSGLSKSNTYTKRQILDAVKNVYSTELFDKVYPRLTVENGENKLELVVQEKERRWLGLDLCYNLDDDFSLGVTLDLNNSLLKNSRLLLGLQGGNKKSINLDYAKNFGRIWGGYYRIYPNFVEQTIFAYDNEHKKSKSFKSKKWGITTGVGLFAGKIACLEGFVFYYKTEFSRGISDFYNGYDFNSAGAGLKLYHETLDDYVFPMKGKSFYARFTKTTENRISDVAYSRLNIRFLSAVSANRHISFLYEGNYGNHFNTKSFYIEPFYVGGLKNSLGYYAYEFSAPTFNQHIITVRVNPFRRMFLDFQVNATSLSTNDNWQIEDYFLGGGIRFGIKTIFGPIIFAEGIDKNLNLAHYFSVGYDFDAFFFSK
ncbi:MAG: patatin-like phospholipase family protein [Candidatus Cloacimonetes bacterium]|nr:patatin-like phospholipase family protein [Candidatus Cloacimonadota bacterium]